VRAEGGVVTARRRHRRNRRRKQRQAGHGKLCKAGVETKLRSKMPELVHWRTRSGASAGAQRRSGGPPVV
jgi:hypothetical protein